MKFQTNRSLVFESGKGSRSTDQYYRNDVFRIGGSERVIRSLSFVGGRRGFYRIDTCDLVALDLFLTAQMMRTLPVDASFYVYPKPFDSQEFRLSLRQINGEVLSKRHLLRIPSNTAGFGSISPLTICEA